MIALPIDAHLDAVRDAVRSHAGVVIVAEPGAGKTTRVPPALLDLVEGEIVVLEPRRIAARLAARFVAEELGEKVGERVGYQVRFDERVSKRTRIRFVTEGILLRRLARDPELRGAGAVIFDELHERHLQGDLALALCRRARERRTLHIVAMSATLDATPIADYLDAPVLRVPGRSFPVEVEHAERIETRRLDEQVAAAVRRTLAEPGGDVLVFLPGSREIRWAGQRCRGPCDAAGAELAVLHGSLAPDAQDKVLRTGGRRKVVLSTNVAESSVTLPGVTTVIDSGLERRAGHDPWTGLPSLTVERISQASAIQRAGRAGRVRAGKCVRLFTEHEFRARPAQGAPEIARLDLAELVLLLRAQGHDPHAFDFLEAPPPAALAAAETLLEKLGALNAGEVTERGRFMQSLPTHPRLARVIDEGCARGVGPRACLLAAILAERDVRSQRSDGDRVLTADALGVIEDIEAIDAEGLRRTEIAARGIQPEALTQVRRARDQLASAARSGREPRASLADEEETLRLCILAGFPDRVGKRDGRRVVFARGGAAELDESSGVHGGELVVAVEVRDRAGAPHAGGSPREGVRSRRTITSACELDAEHVLELFPDRVVERESMRFDRGTEQVERVRALEFDGLVLDESVHRDGHGPEVAQTLARAAKETGLSRFFDLDALTAFQRRVEFANSHGLLLGDTDDAAIDRALELLCENRRSFADLQGADLVRALGQTFDPSRFAHFDRVAPTRVTLAGRRSVEVHYEADRPPWIASRLQDFFGLSEGPRVGGEPLVLHLLAPNRRAVQVTTDLAGFWERHYPALRRQLMRRYPKHAWPEDPR